MEAFSDVLRCEVSEGGRCRRRVRSSHLSHFQRNKHTPFFADAAVECEGVGGAAGDNEDAARHGVRGRVAQGLQGGGKGEDGGGEKKSWLGVNLGLKTCFQCALLIPPRFLTGLWLLLGPLHLLLHALWHILHRSAAQYHRRSPPRRAHPRLSAPPHRDGDSRVAGVQAAVAAAGRAEGQGALQHVVRGGGGGAQGIRSAVFSYVGLIFPNDRSSCVCACFPLS